MPRLEAVPNTPQWVAARRGCLTASRFGDATSKLKKGGWSSSRQEYLVELVAERMSGVAVDHFVTPAMLHGIETEPLAVEAYEAETGIICGPSAFYLHDQIEFFGATPDRLVGRDGLLQVKCPTTKTFVKWLREGTVPEEHIPQMLCECTVTGRAWCDFMAYDPRIQVGPKTFIRRYTPTDEARMQCQKDAAEFLCEVDSVFEFVTTGGLESRLKQSLELVK